MGMGMGMIRLAVEYVPVEVAVLDWGTFVSDSGPDDGREYGWLSLDTMTSVETIELTSDVFAETEGPRAVFETYSPLETEFSPYVLTHWDHPLVRCLLPKKRSRGEHTTKALAFHLCSRCEDGLLAALTSSNRMAITGPVSDDYDEEEETTWPTFLTVRTSLTEVRLAELGAWRRAYKRHADEGEQLTIYSDVG
jgi:hypothetical protein